MRPHVKICGLTRPQDVQAALLHGADMLGFIVEASESQLQSLQNQHPDMNVRVLSPTYGFYELSNVALTDLKAVFPSQPVEKNAFITIRQQKLERQLGAKAFNTSKDAVAAVKTCRQAPTEPKVSITATISPEASTIQLGEKVEFSATATADPSVGGDVRLIWDVIPPQFSKIGFTKGITDGQSFTPDSVGLYQVAIIAQDKDLTCNGKPGCSHYNA